MDILDIDEALKDDSFIFLEDKTHDDVSNILQQWRNNNCTSSNNSEQAFKLNTRTFTRPKRKSAQNLEAQFVARSPPCTHAYFASPSKSSPVPNSQQNSPNVNLEIGGLVTNMQKSFLQDTSPPSSICSSMEVSINGMNGSLITSADFTNINFLQSTRGDEPLSGLFFDTEKSTEDGYTLSDMIRDRKALESLTLSGEGTLIKDSNIAQIDDISLINSKTTSACSTMNNSTDSMGGSGGGCSETFSTRTCNISEREEVSDVPQKSMERKVILNETFPSGKEQIAPNIDDDFIANTTFNLVDSSIMPVQQADEVKIVESCGLQNETFRKPATEEATCPKRFSIGEVVNTTFDCSEGRVQCETPESAMKHAKYYEQSTPQQNTSYTSLRQKQQYTPSIKAADVNISPIIGPPMNRTFNETFDKFEGHNHVPTNILKERVNNETFLEPIPLTRLPCTNNPDYEAEVNLAFETMELLENINPNETFNKSHLIRTPSVDAADEEAFDNLLDNIGKIELNEEQIKMKKSLDTIKKRFTYGAMDKPEAKESSLISSSEMASSGLSMSSSGGGDRLLSRRSRLYDDINITKTLKSSPNGSINSISFVKETEGGGGGELDDAHKKTDEQHCTTATESNEFTNLEEKAARNSKLEKRDRDRFKTIRIFKRQEDGSNELNVPCIDGESHHEPEHLPSTAEEEAPQAELPPVERASRRGNTPPVLFNNNKSEVESNQSEIESNNYATFKKPKDKVRKFGGFAGGVNADQLNRPVIPPVEKPVEQRSLSRPRYLSGLQKFGATNKAISAGDLERTAQHTGKPGDGENFNKTQQPTAGELKSPMGTKSKSFHNLSSNFGYGAPKPALLQTGVRKSTTAGNVLTEKQGKVNTTRTTSRISTAPASTNLKQPISKVEKPDESVFKTPSLVSGLRAPSAKRTGLIRPSSGYYSCSVTKGGDIVNTADLDAGRHSPTDSMSSASSRGSSNGKPFMNGTSSIQQHQQQQILDSSLMPPPSTSSLQQPATKSTGIPKPSGLRPPSNIKRSGLPRPASIVRR